MPLFGGVRWFVELLGVPTWFRKMPQCEICQVRARHTHGMTSNSLASLLVIYISFSDITWCAKLQVVCSNFLTICWSHLKLWCIALNFIGNLVEDELVEEQVVQEGLSHFFPLYISCPSSFPTKSVHLGHKLEAQLPRKGILSSNFDIQIFTTLFEVLMQPSFWLWVMTIDLFVDGVGFPWQSFSQDSRGLCLSRSAQDFAKRLQNVVQLAQITETEA